MKIRMWSDTALKPIGVIPATLEAITKYITDHWNGVGDITNVTIVPYGDSEGECYGWENVFAVLVQDDICAFTDGPVDLEPVTMPEGNIEGTTISKAEIVGEFENTFKNDPAAYLVLGRPVYQVTEDELFTYTKNIIDKFVQKGIDALAKNKQDAWLVSGPKHSEIPEAVIALKHSDIEGIIADISRSPVRAESDDFTATKIALSYSLHPDSIQKTIEQIGLPIIKLTNWRMRD